VSQNLKTTIDINDFLGIRPGQTLTINYNDDLENNYSKASPNIKNIDKNKK
jgi:hypothetical protein